MEDVGEDSLSSNKVGMSVEDDLLTKRVVDVACDVTDTFDKISS
jgi:hypothetical protein